jgi:hypothetical protein
VAYDYSDLVLSDLRLSTGPTRTHDRRERALRDDAALEAPQRGCRCDRDRVVRGALVAQQHALHQRQHAPHALVRVGRHVQQTEVDVAVARAEARHLQVGGE